MGYDIKRSAQSYPFAALHGIKIVDGRCSAAPTRSATAWRSPSEITCETDKNIFKRGGYRFA
jgi:hypothetical protein